MEQHTAFTERKTQEPTKAERLLCEYERNHQHPMNELIHLFAVPAIMLSVIGLAYSIHPGGAYLFVLASIVYYWRLQLSAKLLASVIALSVLMLLIVHAMGHAALKASIGIFVAGWIFQFVGHKIEGRKPSFLQDVQHLWLGPVFVLSKLSEKLTTHD